jgi:signal transduction histidine kinase
VKVWSLKVRLLTLAAIGISLVLGLAGFGFSWLYRQHVEKFVMTELTMHLEQLLADVTVLPDGLVAALPKLSDPRFEQPGGGLYWQIDIPNQSSLRSRSLWDEAIVVPTPPKSTDEDHAHILQLASGAEIFALEKLIVASNESGVERSVVVTVGIDRDRVTNPMSEFRRALLVGLALTYATLLASTLAIISLGLKPLQEVKRGIALLRSGASLFNSDRLPSEVIPLAEEVNALVVAREQQLESARKRASNLAHGLKTPLAVMMSVANELRSKGHVESADNISLNTGQMRDLVDRELTRSRMADGLQTHRADFAEVIQKVIATMRKAPRGAELQWNLAVPEGLKVAMDRVDLTELLGNLLDNARKHAREGVRVSHDKKTLVVEDDGLGVADAELPLILRRGVQLDEKMPGSGIGLAIVSDLADVYGLTLAVRRSDLGGLAVEVSLPAV